MFGHGNKGTLLIRALNLDPPSRVRGRAKPPQAARIPPTEEVRNIAPLAQSSLRRTAGKNDRYDKKPTRKAPTRKCPPKIAVDAEVWVDEFDDLAEFPSCPARDLHRQEWDPSSPAKDQKDDAVSNWSTNCGDSSCGDSTVEPNDFEHELLDVDDCPPQPLCNQCEERSVPRATVESASPADVKCKVNNRRGEEKEFLATEQVRNQHSEDDWNEYDSSYDSRYQRPDALTVHLHGNYQHSKAYFDRHLIMIKMEAAGCFPWIEAGEGPVLYNREANGPYVTNWVPDEAMNDAEEPYGFECCMHCKYRERGMTDNSDKNLYYQRQHSWCCGATQQHYQRYN